MNDISLYENVRPLDRNFQIKLNHTKHMRNIAAHWHEATELLYFTKGNGTVICAGKRYAVKEQELFIVNSSELHAIEHNEPVSYACLRVIPTFFADIDFENVLLQPVVSDDRLVQKYFMKMILEKKQKMDGWDMAVKGTAYLLMSHLLRHYRHSQLSEEALARRHRRVTQIRTILEYISLHYGERLTTGILAKQFFLDESHLCHIFRQETGQTLTSYINHLRVEKAAILLENTQETITEIAAHVGFDDSNYFSRLFRAHMGITPREYRAKQPPTDKRK